ncbi:MAG: phosphoglycerate dehydrogenase [Clostridia bacterium]
MYNIKLFNKISQTGLVNFDDKYTCAEDMANADAILVRSAKMHDEVFEESVKCIARAGAGVNNIPLERCAKEGIVVFNTPGANANAVKEMVITGLLISSRKVVDGIEWAKTLADKGDDVEALVEKGKGQFVGPEIQGKKLGIIGLGAIGVLVANACKHLGMEIYGYDPYLSVKGALNLTRDIHYCASLKEIFENCDYITIHVPFNKDTKDTVSAETIATMKDGVRILNFARGGLVNDDAIIAALESGKVSAYVTDFPNAKLIACDKVIPIPHLGASTPESEDNCAVMAVKEVREYLENGNIVNSVNYPNLELAREASTRICIANENVPNMVGTISTILANAHINIENMANRSMGDVAYTIIETNSDVTDAMVEEIKANAGIIRVRVIK